MRSTRIYQPSQSRPSIWSPWFLRTHALESKHLSVSPSGSAIYKQRWMLLGKSLNLCEFTFISKKEGNINPRLWGCIWIWKSFVTCKKQYLPMWLMRRSGTSLYASSRQAAPLLFSTKSTEVIAFLIGHKTKLNWLLASAKASYVIL